MYLFALHLAKAGRYWLLTQLLSLASARNLLPPGILWIPQTQLVWLSFASVFFLLPEMGGHCPAPWRTSSMVVLEDLAQMARAAAHTSKCFPEPWCLPRSALSPQRSPSTGKVGSWIRPLGSNWEKQTSKASQQTLRPHNACPCCPPAHFPVLSSSFSWNMPGPILPQGPVCHSSLRTPHRPFLVLV
jgi:hypothetical protein